MSEPVARPDALCLEQVAAKLAPHSTLLTAWPLQGGISAQMTGLELQRADGRSQRVIVRRPGAQAAQANPQAASDEFRLLRIIQAAGVPAPRPLLLDSSGAIFPEPYLVMEYIEGEPDYAPALEAGRIHQVAALLAKIHAVKGDSIHLSFLPSQAARPARTMDRRSTLLDDTLDEARIRAVLEAVWPLTPVNAPALLHGDFWPGNWLWRDGQLVAVIDWEDAEVGEPPADLAITRLDLLWIFGPDAMQEFTQHYRSLHPLDYSQLPYWDLVAALRPMSRLDEWAAGWPDLGRSDITAQSMAAGHRWFVEQALEQLGMLY